MTAQMTFPTKKTKTVSTKSFSALKKPLFAAVFAALGAVLVTTSSSSPTEAHPKYSACKKRVGVTVSFPGRPPFWISRKLAKKKAIDKWRQKTRNRYGGEFARWRNARDKFTDAEGGNRFVYYSISANPCRSDPVLISHKH